MNHETTIKQIQSLVPDVMALEFGCVVETNIFPSYPCHFRLCYKTWKSDILVCENNEGEQVLLSINDCEILGKPITLAVVLLAIKTLVCKRCGGAGGTLGSGMGYSECEDCGGDKYDLPEDFAGTEFELGDILHYWNLSKDNFRDQSEETKTFIGELLN